MHLVMAIFTNSTVITTPIKKYQASLLVAQGTFRIVDNLGPAENGIILIYFDSSTTGEQLQYDSQTLTIGTSAADGPAWTYQKIFD